MYVYKYELVGFVFGKDDCSDTGDHQIAERQQ